MRWITCTPVPFSGGEDFFSRDSGALCLGFLALGLECAAIMPEPRSEADLCWLKRVPYGELENPAWWKTQEADGVVLYAWGAPRYRRIAAAIRKAGIFLLLNQDSAGVISPLNGLGLWTRDQWLSSGAGRVRGGWIRFFVSLAKGLTVGLIRTEIMRARHLRCGDVIAAVSPAAAAHYRKLCRIYGGKELASKVEVVPHPVSPIFTEADSGCLEHRILSVGRWDDEKQKRTKLMLSVVQMVLAQDEVLEWSIVGSLTSHLASWHASLPEPLRRRVSLTGKLAPSELADLMRRTKVLYCSSAYESFHISSAEALCSGCSVVGPKLPGTSSFEWFCGEECGTLITCDSLEGHVGGVLDELRAWEAGGREPRRIARIWRPRFHASQVASRILALKESRTRGLVK